MTIIASEITNIHSPNENSSWSQATLPVRSGGLGIRKAVQVAPSAYLASTASSTDLVYCIVPHIYAMFLSPPARKSRAQGTVVKRWQPPVPWGMKPDHVRGPGTVSQWHLLLTSSWVCTRPQSMSKGIRSLAGSSANFFPWPPYGRPCKQSEWQLVCTWAPLCTPHTCCHCGSEVDAL